MEIFDLLKLIDNETIEKIVSIFTSNKHNQPQQNYSQNDFSSPYWQMPNYSASPPPTQESTFSDILSLVKLLLPLLQTKKTSEPQSSNSDVKSTILSLPKIN